MGGYGKRGIPSLQDGGAPCVHEALGIVFFVVLLLTGSGLLFWAWIVEYLIPIAELVGAECMVLHAEQESGHTLGFNQEPLYRARIQVHLLDSMAPTCCCNTTEGVPRCAEWAGVAYDTMQGRFTPKAKPDFVQRYGSVGSFYPCWHSPDKQTITFVRELNYVFLMAPCVVALAGGWGVYRGADKVARWLRGMARHRQGYKQAWTDEERGGQPVEKQDGVLGNGKNSAGKQDNQGGMKERHTRADL